MKYFLGAYFECERKINKKNIYDANKTLDRNIIAYLRPVRTNYYYSNWFMQDKKNKKTEQDFDNFHYYILANSQRGPVKYERLDLVSAIDWTFSEIGYTREINSYIIAQEKKKLRVLKELEYLKKFYKSVKIKFGLIKL